MKGKLMKTADTKTPTKMRTLRMGELWDQASEVAAEHGVTTTDFVAIAMQRLLDSARRDAVLAKHAARR